MVVIFKKTDLYFGEVYSPMIISPIISVDPNDNPVKASLSIAINVLLEFMIRLPAKPDDMPKMKVNLRPILSISIDEAAYPMIVNIPPSAEKET